MSTTPSLQSSFSESQSLWLELTIEGTPYCFELPASEAHAVTVGSSRAADLCINGAGIAPIHFHIERSRQALWIVPAYGSDDLRVGAARVVGTAPIGQHAVIELSDLKIDAHVSDSPPASSRRSSTANVLDTSSPIGVRPSRVSRKPHEADAFSVRSWLRDRVDCDAPTICVDHLVATCSLTPELPTLEFSPPSESGSVQAPDAPSPVRERAPVAFSENRDQDEPTVHNQAPVTAAGSTAPKAAALRASAKEQTPEVVPFWLTELEQCSRVVAALPARPASAKPRKPAPPLDQPQESPPEPEPPASSLDQVATTRLEPLKLSATAHDQAWMVDQSATEPDIVPRSPGLRSLLRCQKNRLGAFYRNFPGRFWVTAFSVTCVLSAGFGLLLGRLSERPVAHAPRAVRSAAAAQTSVTQSHPSSPIATSDAAAKILIVPPAASTKVETKNSELITSNLTTAVESLISGHYQEAHKAYDALSRHFPDNESLKTLSRLLQKKTGPDCNANADAAGISCPEMKL